jgi:hypothetical protein
MIWIGVHPTPFLERMEHARRAVLESVEFAQRAGASGRAAAAGHASAGPTHRV